MVSNEIKISLRKWSSNIGVEEEKLINVFEQLKNKIKENEPALQDRLLDENALIAVRMHLEEAYGSLRSPAEMVSVIIFGVDDLFDTAGWMRWKAEEIVKEKGLEFAKREGYVNSEGKPVDFRKFNVDPGSDGKYGNDDYGSEPPEHLYNRKLYGVAWLEESKGPITIYVKGDSAKNMTGVEHLDEPSKYKVPLFQPVDVRLNIGDDSGNMIYANYSDVASKFTPKDDMDVDIPLLIRNSYQYLYPEDLEDFHEDTGEPQIVTTEGIVTRVKYELSDWDTRFLVLKSVDAPISDRGIPCSIFSHVPYPFLQGDKVIVFGRTRKAKKSGNFRLDVMGIYPLADYSQVSQLGIDQDIMDQFV